jgi:hypothetical protein
MYRENQNLRGEDATVFGTAVKNVWRVFGPSSFRRPDENGDLRLNKSVPLADAEMVALSGLAENRIDDNAASRIKQGFAELCLRNDVFKKAITAGTNGKGAIRSRVELARELVAAAV